MSTPSKTFTTEDCLNREQGRTIPQQTVPEERKNPSSHDWARNVKAFADFLLSRPAFETAYTQPTEIRMMTFWSANKDQFITAAKALGTGKKEFTETEIKFTVTHEWGEFTIKASRNVVCRLIKAAEYECDPFLSPDEEQNLGGAA